MENEDTQTAECLYEIVVKGELDQSWSGWLNGMSMQIEKMPVEPASLR